MAPIYIMIDQEKTGRNILDLMNRKGMQVKDIQGACGFEKPQAVYKWLHGQTLPSIDNLLILSRLFETDLEGILAVSEDALPHYGFSPVHYDFLLFITGFPPFTRSSVPFFLSLKDDVPYNNAPAFLPWSRSSGNRCKDRVFVQHSQKREGILGLKEWGKYASMCLTLNKKEAGYGID